MPPPTRKLHRRIFQRGRRRAYQYGVAGNITQIASERGQTQYAYDALQRLTLASPDTALKLTGKLCTTSCGLRCHGIGQSTVLLFLPIARYWKG